MFGIIADLIASVTTILLPIYASYKALRTSDPTQLTPWLLYWVVLSSLLLIESWTVFVIGWIPLYSWVRLFFLSYLVLPQTQGARFIYYTYIEPFIVQHEGDIDVLIGHAHEKASELGLGYLNTLVDLFCERVLGRPPISSASLAPSPPTAASYAQSLFSRFAIPTTTSGSASDFYSMLSNAATTLTAVTTAGPSNARNIDALTSSSSFSSHTSNPIFTPPSSIYTSPAEKAAIISSQREKLTTLLRALDDEQHNLNLDIASVTTTGTFSEKKKSRSTNSFETVEHIEIDEMDNDDVDAGQLRQEAQRRRSGGSRTSGGVSSARVSAGGWGLGGWWYGASPAAVPEDRGASDSPSKPRDDHLATPPRPVSGARLTSGSKMKASPNSGGSKGWSTAADITDAVQSSGTSSGVERY